MYPRRQNRRVLESIRFKPANNYAYVGNDPLNAVDPYGLRVLQIGIQAQGVLGVLFSGFESGIAIDTHGNVGLYKTLSAGVGAGLETTGGIHLAYSPTVETVYDLRGAGNTVGASGGAVVALGADITVAQEDGALTYGVSVGFGGGASAQGGGSYTFQVDPLFGTSRESDVQNVPQSADPVNGPSQTDSAANTFISGLNSSIGLK